MNGDSARLECVDAMRNHFCQRSAIAAVLLAVLWLAAPLGTFGQAATASTATTPPPVLSYINHGWDVLTRSMDECTTIVDPKITGKSVLYIPADFPITDSVRQLEKRCGVQIRALPHVIHQAGEVDTASFNPQGLLYLPHPYVVPGGRFNEMYGWDSYFIIRGLVLDNRVSLARGMVENFFFEIEHYGSILNANRTYYLSRAQQPFLTSMIFAVYNAEKEQGHADRAWLERAYGYAVRDHDMWLRPELLAGDTGLSRYFDFGEGPAPESLKDEKDHYRNVVQYFLIHPEQNDRRLDMRQPNQDKPLGPGTVYVMRLCDLRHNTDQPAQCDDVQQITLSRDYYQGDRAMRESGFDITFRFGPFGGDTHHYAAVCLNSLLYKTEMDLAEMSEILGRSADSQAWKERAAARRAAMNKYLWDDTRGEFFDYDFMKGVRSTYQFLSTFYPLWTGLATPAQAKAVVASLKNFEQPGGVVMSTNDSGVQWDFPYAWAPTELITVEALRRYGFQEDADRVSFKFADMVARNYAKEGYIVEKYNAVTRGTDAAVSSGYQINVVGFGWTNGVYLEFLKHLPPAKREELSKIQ